MRNSWLIAALALAGCSSIVSGKLDGKPSSSAMDASVAMDASLDVNVLPDAPPGPDAAVGQCFDDDGDGFGVGEGQALACAPGVPQDCNDDNANIYPGADEVCDGEDTDCDGEGDDDLIVMGYLDRDGDGFGGNDAIATPVACSQIAPERYSLNNLDCLDVGRDAYCVNPLYGTNDGLCSASEFDFSTSAFEIPTGGTSWDYNCDNVITKQHAENISCFEPANDGICTTPGSLACSGEVGIFGTASCGEFVTVWTCRGADFCSADNDECINNQNGSYMGCR